ncbi:MAG: folylpolyglutamate synthase/dihydrofolate synthase family protein [Pseudomonadota bacterium]
MVEGSALNYLYSLRCSGIKLGLENVRSVLATLGDPQLALPCIHVGGTNGKGSVCAMLSEIFRQAGFRVGLYTSPHLSDFGERIQTDGRRLSPERLDSLVDLVRDAAAARKNISLTFFEFATAMALLEFASHGVEVAIIEVGMGGRLDATNVVSPLVSVITNVSRDHTEYLGRTLAQVAGEKAGIVKPGVPAVTAARGPALAVVRERCREVGAPLLELGRHFRLRGGEKRGFSYEGRTRRLSHLKLGLAGEHQACNASLVLAAVETAEKALGRVVPEEAIRAGLSRVSWPGRLERLGDSPLILLDGAHNPAGARALAAWLARHARGRLILVTGVCKDKDARGILRPLLPLAEVFVTCAAASERALNPEDLAEVARVLLRGQLTVEVVPQVAAAVARGLQLAGPDDTVCVCGSLFVVGEARDSLLARADVSRAGLFGPTRRMKA